MRSCCTIKSKQTRNEYTFKKELGITIKKVSKQVASYLAKKLLVTHATGSVGYHFCLFMQTQFLQGRYIYECTNETHFLANLKDLIPTFAGLYCLSLSMVVATYLIVRTDHENYSFRIFVCASNNHLTFNTFILH